MPFDDASVIRNTPDLDHDAVRRSYGRKPLSRYLMLLGVAAGGALGAFAVTWWWNSGAVEEAQAQALVRPQTTNQSDLRDVVDKPDDAKPATRDQRRPTRAASNPVRDPPNPPSSNMFAFEMPPAPEGFTFDGTVPVDGLGCTLRPGANDIHAVLQGVVQSEVGGQAVADVSHDILDADGYGQTLIPAGSKLLGVYKPGGRLRFGDERLPFVWQLVTFPPGWPLRQVRLPDAAGLDIAGSMGVGGEVRAHWGEIIAAAALFTVFDVGQRGVTGADNSFTSQLSDSATNQFGRLGEDVTRQMLDVEPDITIPSGTPIVVQPSRPVKVSNACG